VSSAQLRRDVSTLPHLGFGLGGDKNISHNLERKENPMALDTGFVAAVLEGVESTLGELIERVETSQLQANLDVLLSRVTALRVSIEPPAQEPEGIEEPEESVPVEAA
jgi:hypothetical protein